MVWSDEAGFCYKVESIVVVGENYIWFIMVGSKMVFWKVRFLGWGELNYEGWLRGSVIKGFLERESN